MSIEGSAEHYRARVLREGLSFGEAPRWHEGRLWFSDFYRHAIYSIDEGGSDERKELDVPTQPSGLGWLPDGDLLYVSMTDQRVMRVRDGVTSLFADVAPYCGFWANEMITSGAGVSYVGNFGFDLHAYLRDAAAGAAVGSPPTTNLVVLGPEGDVRQVVPDLAFPNGTVITPNGQTLVVGETIEFRLSAFDVASDGTLSNRRVWAQLDFVATDGMCLDADGQIWLANALGTQCLRVREGGEVTAVIDTSQNAFACMLGGEQRTTLYIMSAPSSDPLDIADTTAGTIEVVEVPAPGAGWP